MTRREKSKIVVRALTAEMSNLIEFNNVAGIPAISDFIMTASEATKARLYDAIKNA